MAIAHRLVDWAYGLGYADLPPELIADIRRRVLDTLGLMIGAAPLPIGRAAHAAAMELGGPGAARILGYGDGTRPHAAALANGTFGHAMDFDDTHNLSIMHSSVPVIATILAMAEENPLTGQDLICLIAVGNELNCRLGSVLPGGFHDRGFHPTSVIGALTAAVLAARLQKLDEPAAVAALGIAGSQAAGVMEAFADGTWSKTMHPGWAAHCGIAAATMAKHGFTGPASIVEGRFGLFRSHLFGQEKALDFSVATDGLGAAWMQLDSSFKPYPCAHAIHSFVDAALRLHREHRLASADIERVEVVVAEHFVGLSCEPRDVKIRPATPTHARASLFYAVAASLCHGRLGVEAYADDAIGDSAVLDLAARSTWIADPTAPDLSRYRGWVRLYMRDGRQYEAVEETNRGSRDNPLSDDALIEKIRGNVGALLPADRTQALVSAVMGLETLDSVARLIDLCVSPQLAARST